MNLKLLKLARTKKGMTQKQMAEKLGFRDKSSYCLIENGKTQISTSTMKRIIAVLQLSEDEAIKIFFA